MDIPALRALLEKELQKAVNNRDFYRAEADRYRHLATAEKYKMRALKHPPRWTPLLEKATKLPMNKSFTIALDAKDANRFRSMLRVSTRTARFKFKVQEVSRNYRIAKTGKW